MILPLCVDVCVCVGLGSGLLFDLSSLHLDNPHMFSLMVGPCLIYDIAGVCRM